MCENEKGITLVEILAAISILSITLISIVQFFPQIGWLNHHNDMKTKGMNLAKKELVEWSHSSIVINYLKDPSQPEPEGYIGDIDGHHNFELLKDGFNIYVQIETQGGLASDPGVNSLSKAHYIHIELKDEKGKQVSETYGYILVPGKGTE